MAAADSADSHNTETTTNLDRGTSVAAVSG